MIWWAGLIGVAGLAAGVGLLGQAVRGATDTTQISFGRPLDRTTQVVLGVVLVVAGGAICYVSLGLGGLIGP
jgi:hypothetical protein